MYTIARPKDLRSDQMMGAHEVLASKYRTLFLYGEVVGIGNGRQDSWNPSYLADQMMAMSLENSTQPIKLFIDTPGGNVRDGYRLIDIMNSVPSPIWTIASTAYSFGAYLLSCGEPGHRYVFPNGRVMLHLPSGQLQGDSEQIDLASKEIQKIKDTLVESLQEHGVKRTKKQILSDINREFFLSAQEAIDYGLADKIIDKKTFKYLYS